MPTLKSILELKENPFANYTAENEPDISSYAVKPAYIDTISQRAQGKKSFILFGDRGAGKSATRVTLFNGIWENKEDSKKPFVVNLLDFSSCLPKLSSGSLSESDLLREVAYVVIEQLLIWLSSLPIEDRETFTEALTIDKHALIRTLMQAFYLSKGDIERRMSEGTALRLLGHAWRSRSQIWATKRWEAISSLIGVISNVLARKVDKDLDVAKPIESILKTADKSAVGGRVILEKLIDFVQIFDFSGIVVLVDKVDETSATTSSAEKSAALISPILTHVQLLEVDGFAWIFFLWDDIRPYFESGRKVRLDKIANTKIEWSEQFLRAMLDERVKYFSDNRLTFKDLFDADFDVDEASFDLIRLSMRSPRELVRLLDTIVTEHDAKFASLPGNTLLNNESLDIGKDKYVTTRVKDVYNAEAIRQICRLTKVRFINKDIQAVFRISVGGARNRVVGWQAAGMIKQTGTRAAEGDQGGKPNYEYTVVDARVARLIERSLIKADELEPLGDEEIEASEK